MVMSRGRHFIICVSFHIEYMKHSLIMFLKKQVTKCDNLELVCVYGYSVVLDSLQPHRTSQSRTLE